MIEYEHQLLAHEVNRVRDHIGVLLAELPECGTPEQLPSDVVTGMAIAYKLIRAMLHARAETLTAPTTTKGTRRG
jgi:hypothetical protein